MTIEPTERRSNVNDDLLKRFQSLIDSSPNLNGSRNNERGNSMDIPKEKTIERKTNPYNKYIEKGVINVDELLEIASDDDSQRENVVAIDYRSHALFSNDHITLFSNIINIDPAFVKASYTLKELLDNTMVLNSAIDKHMMEHLNKFQLVIIIDDASIFNRLSQSLIQIMRILKTIGNNKFVILEGGYSEWEIFMNGGVSKSHMQSALMLSRSPSPPLGQNIRKTNLKKDKLIPIVSKLNHSNVFAPQPLSKMPLTNGSTPNISSTLTLLSSPSSGIDLKSMATTSQLNSTALVTSHSQRPSRSPIPFLRHHKHHHYHPGFEIISGLVNLGNTCYMNAALQCLVNTRELTDFLIENDYEKFVAKRSRLGSHGELTNYYQSLAKSMISNTLKRKTSNPKSFKKELGKLNPQFKGNEQQDSAEFLHYILDTVHEDLNIAFNGKKPSELTREQERGRETLPIRLASTIEWERYLVTNYSTIIETFAGQYSSRLICESCKSTSTTYIPFTMLTLPIPATDATTNIYDCIDKFVQPEKLEGDNAWNCSECHQQSGSTKTLKITRLPKVLIIHLERFKYSVRKNAFEKDNSVVQISQVLHMSKYWPRPASGEERTKLAQLPLRGQNENCSWDYQLRGVVRHYGGLQSGHYIADVLKREDQWLRFDDDSFCSIKDVARDKDGSEYVLFYELNSV